MQIPNKKTGLVLLIVLVALWWSSTIVDSPDGAHIVFDNERQHAVSGSVDTSATKGNDQQTDSNLLAMKPEQTGTSASLSSQQTESEQDSVPTEPETEGEFGDKPASVRISEGDDSYHELAEIAANKMKDGESKTYFDWGDYSVTATRNEDGTFAFDLIDHDFFSKFSSSEEIVQHNLENLNQDSASGAWDTNREEQFRRAFARYVNMTTYSINLLTCRERRCVAEVFVQGGAKRGAQAIQELITHWQGAGHVVHGLYFGNSVWSFDVYFEA